ncbi:MAG: hypothetical protein OEW18_00370 [Candidatus Aminicenantes bacterium]|nr:hypothetical protein [Candidatus Aminicenantes bacterium]
MTFHRRSGLFPARVVLGLSIVLLAAAPWVRGEAIQDARPPAADFSGLLKFLEITATLAEDKEPTSEQWDALFATPGYAVLLKREFQRDFFVDRFRLAFMPSRAEALKEQLKKDTGFRAQFLPHYLRAKAMRPEIEQWMAAQRPPELYREAVEKARALLPEGAIEGWPAVAFVIFAPDARGYDPIVLDALYCMDTGDRLAELVGHEFHHYYRDRFVDLTQDQATLWVIDQIHAEGIADLIDKAEWTRKKEEALTPGEKDFVKLFRESPSVIRTMDELLARMSEMRTGRGELGFQLRRIVPQSGHPTGLYMALLILEELGRPAIVKVACDPFGFFRLYQDAAAKRGGDTPRFSDAAMKFLDQLAPRR